MITNIEWVSFGALEIKSGDTLFVRTERVDPDQDERLKEMLPGVNIIYVAPDTEIGKVSSELDPQVGIALSGDTMKVRL